MIITGRGDVTTEVLVKAGGPAPTTLEIPSLGIAAPVSPIGIDLATGDLGVSPDIHKLGWWRDGAAPGAGSGSVLIAGHVDSATAGAGALFPLKNARTGALVEITMSDGQTVRYSVVSVRLYPKKDLPLDVYSQTGPPRLVVVTCGGPFDTATRHYDDNVILTAVPA
jgi:sortase (surface protein transpeptidase)